MKKIEITEEEFKEYETLKKFFVYVQKNFYSVRMGLLNIKYIAFAGIKDQNSGLDWFLLNAEKVGKLYQFIDEMYNEIVSYPFLTEDIQNNAYDKYTPDEFSGKGDNI